MRELNADDEQAFLTGLKLWPSQERHHYTFFWKPNMAFSKYLSLLDQHKKGLKIPRGMVASTMFYGFVDGHIVGRLHVRHSLNKGLLFRGGHIGYAVAKKYRNRGYASVMLKQALPYLQNTLKTNKVLLTCAKTNLASLRVIQSCDGVLENIVWDQEDQEEVCRFWIELKMPNL